MAGTYRGAPRKYDMAQHNGAYPGQHPGRRFGLFARKLYGLEHTQSRATINALADFIIFELSAGRKVRFDRIGEFSVRKQKCNLKLSKGQAMRIWFKPSATLKNPIKKSVRSSNLPT